MGPDSAGCAAADPLLRHLKHFLSGVGGKDAALAAALAAVAATAAVLPPYYGYRYEGNFWAAMFSTSDAMTSMTLDVLLAGVAFLVWMAADMRALGFSLVSFVVFVALCAV